ncbi:hypothetical protein Zmor_005765 [Zophobas morio]|uniref:Uncharacterized protein n=1 Tax=Zophobas morio TaxID=2755281 RepID=A0AA38IQC1_9CUCU|nr:hypothetical protein Zmor_005765 [Zophobas morio]
MESIIYDQLSNFLLDQNLIPPEQYTFLPGKSIHSNLLSRLCQTGRERLISRIPLISSTWTPKPSMEFLDVDCCINFSVFFGVRGSFMRWIEFFLSDRTFSVR